MNSACRRLSRVHLVAPVALKTDPGHQSTCEKETVSDRIHQDKNAWQESNCGRGGRNCLGVETFREGVATSDPRFRLTVC